MAVHQGVTDVSRASGAVPKTVEMALIDQVSADGSFRILKAIHKHFSSVPLGSLLAEMIHWQTAQLERKTSS